MVRRVGNVANAGVLQRLSELGIADPHQPISRTSIAHHYLRGRGIEIGALHRPLPVPPGASVDYVDVAPADILAARFPEVGAFKAPDIIADGETLTGIDDHSYDFVIANHFLEHAEDPFAALKTFVRVLRPGGRMFLAIPDKRWTFDKPRAITDLAHLLRDHAEGPAVSRRAHYEEWLRVIDGFSGEALQSRIEAFTADRVNIHFHVWTIREMSEMFIAAKDILGLPIEILLTFADEAMIEVIWILQVSRT